MDEEKKQYQKMQCLELAVKVAGFNANGTNVINTAESYWQWMNGSHDAAKTPTPNDDISF